jgi:hypothetical protein
MAKTIETIFTSLPKHQNTMCCAPLEAFSSVPSWASQTPRDIPATDPEAVIALAATDDLEKAYRMTLRANGIATEEGASLFDHMRAIGLLPRIL